MFEKPKPKLEFEFEFDNATWLERKHHDLETTIPTWYHADFMCEHPELCLQDFSLVRNKELHEQVNKQAHLYVISRRAARKNLEEFLEDHDFDVEKVLGLAVAPHPHDLFGLDIDRDLVLAYQLEYHQIPRGL